MKKNVLIPTDFTIESLNTVKHLLNSGDKSDVYSIILLCGVNYSDSISDMLFFSKARELDSLNNDVFKDACTVIKNKYASTVVGLRTDLFTGSNQAAFNQYLQANAIDEIFIPAHYTLRLPKRKGMDLHGFISGCRRPVHLVEWKMKVVLPEKGELAEVFYNELAG